MSSNPVKPILAVRAPARNLRRVVPICCATCVYFENVDGDGYGQCRRDEGFQGDLGDGEQWFHRCDGYRWEGVGETYE